MKKQMPVNYKKIYAKKKEYREKILKVCPDCPDTSGIYFLIRRENGFKWAYIGQAKHLLTRLAQHLEGHEQHIDKSLKKHGLFSEENPGGWGINFLPFPERELDAMEQYYIKKYANAGFQLRNHESGGKDGKIALENRNERRGYREGVKRGEQKAKKYIADLFSKHLNAVPKKDPPTKLQENALEKFNRFLREDQEEGESNVGSIGD